MQHENFFAILENWEQLKQKFHFLPFSAALYLLLLITHSMKNYENYLLFLLKYEKLCYNKIEKIEHVILDILLLQ